jgi:hypothetical protein
LCTREGTTEGEEERTFADTLINHDQLNRFKMEFFSPLLFALLARSQLPRANLSIVSI